jgi:diadenosine tetraphosphatase ApaH/serine/threonine PP2A family protein phosphatase
VRQILQSKSGIFGEKFNETSRKKGFPIAKGLHRNKSNEYLFEDREEKSLLRIMEGAGADILCFGHTHKPFHRILDGGTADSPRYRHAINIGSVGKPKDGDPRGCYAWIELDENSSLSKPDTIRVSFVRFEYDVEKSARAVEESILPDAYAAALRLGR